MFDVFSCYKQCFKHSLILSVSFLFITTDNKSVWTVDTVKWEEIIQKENGTRMGGREKGRNACQCDYSCLLIN